MGWAGWLAPVEPSTPYPLGGGELPAAFRPVLEPVEPLTFVAGHTSRVRLGTSVLSRPWYDPLLLARRLATLDVLSGGRLRAGFGVGGLPRPLGRAPRGGLGPGLARAHGAALAGVEARVTRASGADTSHPDREDAEAPPAS